MQNQQFSNNYQQRESNRNNAGRNNYRNKHFLVNRYNIYNENNFSQNNYPNNNVLSNRNNNYNSFSNNRNNHPNSNRYLITIQ